MNDLERYYQDLYSSTTRTGLNIRLTKSSDRSGKFSEESKKKMSEAKKGKKRSEDVKKSISEKMKKIADYLVGKNRYITMLEYTGMTDINDVEIYEGDILQYDVFGSARKLTNQKLEVKLPQIFTRRNGMKNLEVIGSIFEHSELLRISH